MECRHSTMTAVFQSTLPLRGATKRCLHNMEMQRISIHAPLAGSDSCILRNLPGSVHFNPRSPCGERRGDGVEAPDDLIFQSTLPLRGATKINRDVFRNIYISIHAPLAGSDFIMICGTCSISVDFNPRSPCGERHNRSRHFRTNIKFQSTLPLRGATQSLRLTRATLINFNPRSPCGERQQSCIIFAYNYSNYMYKYYNAIVFTCSYVNIYLHLCHSFVYLFGANLWAINDQYRFALHYECPLRFIITFLSKLFYLRLVFIPKIVVTKTVFFFINDTFLVHYQ